MSLAGPGYNCAFDAPGRWPPTFPFSVRPRCLILAGMPLMPYWAGLGLLIFAGMSFFFALAESALFSLGQWQVRQLAERSPAAGGLVARLLAEPQHLLATIVLGNTVANASIVAIALLSAPWDHWLFFVVAARRCSCCFWWVARSCPRRWPLRAPELWALRVARPMHFLQSFSEPFRRVAQRLDSAILRVIVPEFLQAAAGDVGRGISGIAGTGLPTGHAGAVGKGNHPANHRAGPPDGRRT